MWIRPKLPQTERRLFDENTNEKLKDENNLFWYL